MRVDIHAHCFPAAYLDALEAGGRAGLASVRALSAGDETTDIDRRLETMDAAGVELEVLSPSSLIPSLAEEREAVAAATLLNDRYAVLAAARPDRFAAFAAVPLPHLDATAAMLADALARPGFVGVAVATVVAGRPISDPAFDPFLAELDRRSAVLFIHPAGEAAGSRLIEDLGLAWPLGAPIEDTVSVTALIARGIPSRFPNLRIVNAHLGGALPMLLGRLDGQFPRFVPDAPELPSVAVRRMWFDTVGHGHAPALRAARDSFGPDRLLLGTDYPYVRGDGHRRAIDYVAAAGLEARETAAILDEQASALIRPAVA